MTATLGDPATTSLTRRQPTALCVLVGAVVVVGWVLYRHYWLQDVADRVARIDAARRHLWLGALVVTLLLCLPYALALLLWGRSLARATAGAVVAMAAGLYLWALGQAFTHYVWDSGRPGQTSIRVYSWAAVLGLAVLVPLAWSLARRTGAAWVSGLLVGPVVAAVIRELQLRSTWWREHVVFDGHAYHWVAEAAQYVAPVVLAVLACWALEVRTRRTAK